MAEMKTLETRYSVQERKLLLKIARESLIHYLNTGKLLAYDENVLPNSLLAKKGAFVSVYKGRALRGCVGNMSKGTPLYKGIQEKVISAAMHDSRFPPLKFTELPQIRIEISIVGSMARMKNENDIELGKHGILIKKGQSRGTFLPQVAVNTGWTIPEFLGYCSKDKACIGWDGWKNAEVYLYTAEVFAEDLP